jgi:hypothetical protein
MRGTLEIVPAGEHVQALLSNDDCFLHEDCFPRIFLQLTPGSQLLAAQYSVKCGFVLLRVLM